MKIRATATFAAKPLLEIVELGAGVGSAVMDETRVPPPERSNRALDLMDADKSLRAVLNAQTTQGEI